VKNNLVGATRRSRADLEERRMTENPRRSVAPRPLARRGLPLFITGIALISAACGTNNTPTAYGDVTRNNFVAACSAAGMEPAGCQQTYDAMSGPDGMPFETFTSISKEIAADPSQIGELATFLEDHPTSPASTSTPTTSLPPPQPAGVTP
jgi:hypothetical protein